MIIFANFAQKSTQFQKLVVVLSEFYLVALSSLQVLGESCWTNAVTIEMFIFAIFELKIDFEQSQFRRIGVAFT